jgi:hypothetical protein
MASEAQIEANRRNSQKSTGPRSPAGKCASRFNALKSGIDAQSLVIPGEDAAELEAVAENYREQYQPENALEGFLVDEMVAADWQLRRLRKVEAQLWRQEAAAGGDLGEAYTRNTVLTRLHRRIDATERSYYRALKQIEQFRKQKEKEKEQEADRIIEELMRAPRPGPELASFRQGPQAENDLAGAMGAPAPQPAG